jgi:hypothetical protein
MAAPSWPTIAFDAHRAHVAPASVVDKTRYGAARRPGGRRWCGRGDSNPHRPCGPTDFLTSYGFRRPRLPREAEGASLWSGLSLHRAPIEPEVRCCPSSLYTFPSELAALRAWLGIASQGFPEFGQFCIRSFPRSTQVASSPLRLPVSPRPRDGSFYIAAAMGGLEQFPSIMRSYYSLNSSIPANAERNASDHAADSLRKYSSSASMRF